MVDSTSDYYEQLRVDLTRAVRRVCPSWLSDRSDDLIQVAMVKVSELQKKSPERRELSFAYLKMTAYSALVDEIRRLRRRREVPIDDDERPLPIAATSANPEEQAAGREIGEGIRECLSKLKRERRYAVTLHLQGHSVPQAAKLLGWSAKRAENYVYRGLADLRQCLTSKGFNP